MVSCNTVNRVDFATNSGSSTRYTSNFTYTNEGAYVMSVVATADGRIAGGGTFPMYEYEMNTTTNAFTYSNIAGGHSECQLPARGNHVYAGSYPYGVLPGLGHDQALDADLHSGTSSTNPKGLVTSSLLRTINRPDTIYPHPTESMSSWGMPD